jgi:fucose permease
LCKKNQKKKEIKMVLFASTPLQKIFTVRLLAQLATGLGIGSSCINAYQIVRFKRTESETMLNLYQCLLTLIASIAPWQMSRFHKGSCDKAMYTFLSSQCISMTRVLLQPYFKGNPKNLR